MTRSDLPSREGSRPCRLAARFGGAEGAEMPAQPPGGRLRVFEHGDVDQAGGRAFGHVDSRLCCLSDIDTRRGMYSCPGTEQEALGEGRAAMEVMPGPRSWQTRNLVMLRLEVFGFTWSSACHAPVGC
ncbi:hypothetical protein Salmuc_02698 [Salipiger mucosus DSM 16094]|uniref:Uncharacterized protein n=1 Tax=Salipiger mucosus DSM 16094 TaxID=1123237 RepID=S9SG94_9RHOB|nr:hypothetical protein Salmuc_02698 [Salipiger mucosus DSM 16094]